MRVSVILAVWRICRGLDNLIEEILSQGPDEVVIVSDVVSTSRLGTRLVSYPRAPTISHLWAEGLRHVKNEIVVFTTSHFSPGPSWLNSLRDAHIQSSAAGIGGPILPPPSRDPGAWAIYFQRYHRWLNTQYRGEVLDIPGDNSSYKLNALLRVHSQDNEAFREFEANAALVKSGERLEMLPNLAIRQTSAFPYSLFLKQRFVHATEFGERRLLGSSKLKSWMYAIVSPGVAPVLFLKIILKVLPLRKLWLPFLYCCPHLMLSILAWSLGEATGYYKNLRSIS